MTTRLELAEMILESEKTGRKILERRKGCDWYVYDGINYNLNSFEYTLSPEVVKHERWALTACPPFLGGFPTREQAIEARESNQSLSQLYIVQQTWETEE